MSALESSPVHCLKPLPSGKRRWSGNAGDAAILIRIINASAMHDAEMKISPIIDICHYRSSISWAVHEDQVLADPCNEVILECALDDLVEKI